MLPESKQPAVKRALLEAFGVPEYESIRPTSGGQSSALVFRIVVRGRTYLLKTMREEKISDPVNEFTCLQTAAAAGIAPKVWYASLDDRVLITDFVEAKPYPSDMALRIAPLLRQLHALPDFTKPAMGNYFNSMDGFFRRAYAAKLLPASVADEIFSYYEALVKVYPRNEADLVACHNDLKPQNMVFDGEHLWLVDWESAFLNDPYVDLAIAANFFVQTEADEARYLAAYFGQAANDEQRARFYLMQQALHLFYAGLFLSLAARAGAQSGDDLTTALDFREFHQRLIANEIDTLQPEAQVQYAKLHLGEALQKMRAARFGEALARLGDAKNT